MTIVPLTTWMLYDAVESVLSDTSNKDAVSALRSELRNSSGKIAEFAADFLNAIQNNELLQFYEVRIKQDVTCGFLNGIKNALSIEYSALWNELLTKRVAISFLKEREPYPALLEIASASLRAKLQQHPRSMAVVPNKIMARFDNFMALHIFNASDCFTLARFMETKMRFLSKKGITRFKKGKYQLPCTVALNFTDKCITVPLHGKFEQLRASSKYKSLCSSVHVPLRYSQNSTVVAYSVNRTRQENSRNFHNKESRNFIYQSSLHECFIARLLQGKPGILQLISSNIYFKEQRNGKLIIEDREYLPIQSIEWELCEGDLFSLIKVIPIHLNQQLQFAENLVIGLTSMHELRICHGDLNATNVLYKQQNAYISDFGFSFIWGSSLPFIFKEGFYATIDATAPELFGNKSFQGDYSKLDLWALGLLLHQMYFRKLHPWSKMLTECYRREEVVSQQHWDFFASSYMKYIVDSLQRTMGSNKHSSYIQFIIGLLGWQAERRPDLGACLKEIRRIRQMV